jgi:hypothetical protein
MRRFVKHAAVIGAVTVAVVGTGVGYAAWNASGSGTGYTKAGTAQPLSSVDVSAGAAAQLYPGATGDLIIKIHNGNSYPVRITSITGTGPAVASGGTGTCTTTGVTFTNQNGVFDVPAGSDAQFTLTGAVHMSNASDDGCQGATFAIPVVLSGSSNAS